MFKTLKPSPFTAGTTVYELRSSTPTSFGHLGNRQLLPGLEAAVDVLETAPQVRDEHSQPLNHRGVTIRQADPDDVRAGIGLDPKVFAITPPPQPRVGDGDGVEGIREGIRTPDFPRHVISTRDPEVNG